MKWPPAHYMTCHECGRASYSSRKIAKNAAKKYPTLPVSVYPCPFGNGYHLRDRVGES